MLHSPKSANSAAVSWRDGIHIEGTAIWCDALRARDICFVSAASTLPVAEHGQLVATPETLGLVQSKKSSTSKHAMGAPLAVPWGQPFTLGNLRLEVFSSGHGLGASSLLIHQDSRRTIYAGSINPNGSELGSALDYRAADVLVLSARYGQPGFAFPDSEAEIAALVERCQNLCESGGIAVLLIRNSLKALETAVCLSRHKVPVVAHHSFHTTCKLGRRLSTDIPSVKRWSVKSKGGHVLLWPAQARDQIDLTLLPKGSELLLVSGSASSPDAVSAAGASAGFVWSDEADYDALIAYIKSSKAKHVYLTNAPNRGKELADALPKIQIQPIGPPKQLHLFGESR